jgi:hypothetical protein
MRQGQSAQTEAADAKEFAAGIARPTIEEGKHRGPFGYCRKVAHRHGTAYPASISNRRVRSGQPMCLANMLTIQWRSKKSLSRLLAADQPQLTPADRQAIARALGRLGDDRVVPVLTDWLRGADCQLKEPALTALESIDSAAAAREARPLLKTEAYLPYKLHLARLLPRRRLSWWPWLMRELPGTCQWSSRPDRIDAGTPRR